MATKSEEQKAMEAEIKRQAEREKEPDELKTIRRLVRETMDEWAADNLAAEEEKKPSGGGGILDSLFGKKPA